MEMEWNFIVRLCVAGLCGTIIGLDREYRVKDAGFRTHFLVALGSALIMIVSQYGFEDFLATHDGLRLDPSRIAAQVVSGIGFIGAGTIIIHRQLVRGLTTAASDVKPYLDALHRAPELVCSIFLLPFSFGEKSNANGVFSLFFCRRSAAPGPERSAIPASS